MLLFDIQKKKARQVVEAHSSSAANSGMKQELRAWGGGRGGVGGESLQDLLTLPLSHGRTHTHQGRKGFVVVVVVVLFLKPFYLKKKKNQIKIFPIGGYFIFCLLKILLHKYLPFPHVRGKMSLLFLKPIVENV